MQKDRFLTIVELSEMIALPKGTIYNGDAETDQLPRIKVGGRLMFSERAVSAWMARKVREAEEKQANKETPISPRQAAVLRIIKRGRRR